MFAIITTIHRYCIGMSSSQRNSLFADTPKRSNDQLFAVLDPRSIFPGSLVSLLPWSRTTSRHDVEIVTTIPDKRPINMFKGSTVYRLLLALSLLTAELGVLSGSTRWSHSRDVLYVTFDLLCIWTSYPKNKITVISLLFVRKYVCFNSSKGIYE